MSGSRSSRRCSISRWVGAPISVTSRLERRRPLAVVLLQRLDPVAEFVEFAVFQQLAVLAGVVDTATLDLPMGLSDGVLQKIEHLVVRCGFLTVVDVLVGAHLASPPVVTRLFGWYSGSGRVVSVSRVMLSYGLRTGRSRRRSVEWHGGSAAAGSHGVTFQLQPRRRPARGRSR